MSRGGNRGLAALGSKGGPLGLPKELPQGLNPELLAQMLGGGLPGHGPLAGPAVEVREEDDGVDRSRWNVLYPAYINKKYTAANGRRVCKAIAVDDPTAQEMKLICDHFAVPAHVEVTKRYPRDWLLSQGRLRIQLRKEDGSLFSSEIPNKKKLMEQMCLLIPKLKTRSVQSPQQAGGGSGKKKKKK